MNFINKNKLKSKFVKNSFLGLIFNVFSIFFSILLIPIIIDYLGKEDYGIWITIFAICNWINFLDGGLGNSLRNELTISLKEKNNKKSKALISTGYISLFVFLVILFVIIILINSFIDWNSVFSNDSINYNLFSLFIFGSFLLQMTLKIISKIFFSFDKSYMSFLIPALINLIYLLVFYILNKYDVGIKMWNTGIVYSIVPLIVLFLISSIFYLLDEPEYRPKLKYFDKKLVRLILVDGLKLFFIQMNAGVFLALTPFFITFWFSPELTSEYHVSVKYYGFMLVLLNIILQNLWGEITKSFLIESKEKIKNILKFSGFISLFFLFIISIMTFFSKDIYYIWLGEEFIVSNEINFACATLIGVIVISKSMVVFLNATNSTKIQSYLSIFNLIFYFPLLYFSFHIMKFGITGIILVPVFLFLIQSIIAGFEVKKTIYLK
ncbi:hypothetical protein OAQ15_01430 [Flavobacteriaceae bacterium]|nr:hypothetical protein [Flavobacteriaceae bacterium]